MSVLNLDPAVVIVEPPAEYSVTVTETIALPPIEIQIPGIQGPQGPKGDPGESDVEPIPDYWIDNLFDNSF
ncbi:MAG: hypothetical protein IKE23_01460 [Exiguobacterium sp.]|nr:hypothetical protein [Exiguobacterium sp.]